MNRVRSAKVHQDRIGTVKIYRKMTATEFGPLGGPGLISASWRRDGSEAVSLFAMEEVEFKLGGVFPG